MSGDRNKVYLCVPEHYAEECVFGKKFSALVHLQGVVGGGGSSGTSGDPQGLSLASCLRVSPGSAQVAMMSIKLKVST